MKFFKILVILMVFSLNVTAQINGNKTLKTITTLVPGLTSIDIQFNANITLDYTLQEEMRIRADENILPFIGIDFENGTLTLDQIKWIEPSQLPSITIGTPLLTAVYQGTHSTTIIKNVSGQQLRLAGNVGQIKAAGKIVELSVNTTGTDIDLAMLEIGSASIAIDDDSKVILDQVDQLKTNISEDARLVFLSEIKNIPESQADMQTSTTNINPDLRWINFSIKNNSWKRNHFVVVGPKKDGSKFSYGFSLLPNVSKKERWSTGTKVFKVKKYGAKELLVTISAEDEGEVVALFK